MMVDVTNAHKTPTIPGLMILSKLVPPVRTARSLLLVLLQLTIARKKVGILLTFLYNLRVLIPITYTIKEYDDSFLEPNKLKKFGALSNLDVCIN